MAKSHPARFYDHPASHPTFWARNMFAGLVLLASFASIAIIVNAHAGDRLPRLIAEVWAAADLTHFSRQVAEPPVVEVNPDDAKHRAVGEHLARRFRVSVEMTTRVVAKAFDVGHELKLDPLLILAIIAVESRFNPVAESVMGAKGLMQVIPRFHADKFGPLGGEQVAFDPAANITVGARILKEYIRRTGDITNALQMYVGASTEESENGYSSKVMAERDRLHGMLSQFQIRAAAALRQAQAKPLPAAI